MPSGIVIARIALLPHADKATRFKLFFTISVMLTQGDAMKRILSGATRKLLRRGIGLFLTERNAPCGINRPSVSPIKSMIDEGHEKEFRQVFRLSRNVFESLGQDLSPWIKDGRSKNGRQNVEARVKVGITLYYMAHGGDGINLGCMSGLKNNLR